jgi:hypothetical protein
MRGLYKPQNPQKYMGDTNSIIFRSIWERLVFRFCDLHPSVKEWGSEVQRVSYVFDGKHRTYYPDVYVKHVDSSGAVVERMVEIKPKAQFGLPLNKAKWAAARTWCARNNHEFIVLSEKEIYGRKK